MQNVIVDGTAKWEGASTQAYCGVEDGIGDCGGCGIRVTSIAAGDSPSHYIKLRGSTNRDVVLRGIDVDGQKDALDTRGIGVNVGDRDVTWNGANWIEGLTFEKMCVRNVDGEGYYIGANWKDSPEQGLRRITVRNNFVHDTGREGIQLKSLWAGTGPNMNVVRNNVVQRTGQRNEPEGHGACYAATGCFVEWSGNYGEDCGVQGIQNNVRNIPESVVEGGMCPHIAFNNVLWKVGVGAGPTTSGYGIGSSSNTDVRPALIAFNNTIVETRNSGITASEPTGGQPAAVYNNVISNCCRESGEAISVSSDYEKSHNRSGSSSSMNFVDAKSGNFRLLRESPAVDGGTMTQYSSLDYDGVERPYGGVPDQGAFEFSNARPAAPLIDIH